MKGKTHIDCQQREGTTMKNLWISRGVMVICSLIFIQAMTFPQDKTNPSEEEMMKRWKEASTPNEMHKLLESLVGSWKAEIKIWMKGPDSLPSVSKGSAQYQMVLGGRFVKEDYKGEMDGQPFTGFGYTGYDNTKKKFIGAWMDDMGTSLTTMEGSLDPDGKTIIFMSKMDDPMTGVMNKDIKYIYKIVDTHKHIFEMYDIARYGDKFPTMQITYTKKKK